MLKTLQKLLDPTGPIGAWLSPSIVYKERQGLPISDGKQYSARATHEIPPADIERACLPTRFVAADAAPGARSGIRQVSLHIEEQWTPLYEPILGDSYAAVAAAASRLRLRGWRVEQRPRSPFCDCHNARFSKQPDGTFIHRACQRGSPRLSDAEVVERALLAQMQPGDTHYEQFAPTIRGDDYCIIRGKEVRGGTRIRSRKHYNQLTKNMVLWDAGTPACIERAKQEQREQRAADTNIQLSQLAHRIVSDKKPGEI